MSTLFQLSWRGWTDMQSFVLININLHCSKYKRKQDYNYFLPHVIKVDIKFKVVSNLKIFLKA